MNFYAFYAFFAAKKSAGEEVEDFVTRLGHEEGGTDLGNNQTAINGREETDVIARPLAVQEQDEDP